MARARSVTTAILLAATAACRAGGSPDPAPAASDTAPVTTPEPPRAPPTVASPLKLVMTWGKARGFKSPESVVHDTKTDLYLVSNVDGKPLERDNKAFISKVAPGADGVETKWIEAGKNGVTLHAPKGMAIALDTLFVADIDTVRLFDRQSGRPTGEVKVPGATFLNGVVAAPDGRVFVSDTGMKDDGKGAIVAGGNDAVYVIEKDKKVAPYAKAPELAGPNGLAWGANALFVATWGKNEVFGLGPTGTRVRTETVRGGKLDGLVCTVLDCWVSSWETRTVYRAPIQSMAFAPAIEGVTSPADLTIDATRKRLVVPLFEADELRAYAIEPQ